MHLCENICNKCSGTLIKFDLLLYSILFTCELTTETDPHIGTAYRHIKAKIAYLYTRADKSLMNNFQGFLTMRTPSNLIQALCFFSILFVELVLTKRPPCEAGRWQYSEGKGRCVRCRCPKGTQLSGREVGQSSYVALYLETVNGFF